MKIFEHYIFKRKTVELAKTKTAVKKSKALLSDKILRAIPPKAEVEMEKLKGAIASAEDIENPNRQMLYGIYLQILEESHLASAIRTARYTVLQSEFKIFKNDTENKEMKKLFEKSWFTDFMTYAIDQEFWGYSLIEFGVMDENNEFKDVTLINRFHVVPEFQLVKLKQDDDFNDAIPYGKNLDNWYLIEVGDKYDMGLLRKAAREVIWKTYARSDWSTASEKYGMPLLSINTDTSNERELDELENMAENFGSNGYIIGSKETDILISQPDKGTQFYINYQNLANFCDDQISKLINGQTGTSDNNAYVGTAEVHERVLNTYTKGRLQRIQRVINDKLIPFLTEKGYPLQDSKFQFVDLLKKETLPTVTDTEEQKKKSELQLNLNNFYNAFKGDNNTLEFALPGNNLKSVFDKLIKRLHTLAGKDKLPEGDALIKEGEALIKETALVYEKALGKGIELAKYTPDQVFKEKLTQSVWVFSGFKTDRQLKDISKLLWAGDKLKPYNKFRDEVLKLNEDYNINWLRTEYNQAVSATQSAVRWNKYEKNADRYFLQYRTAGDERVRTSHANLNRITLPVSDSFWDEHYPPNGWGCRCSVIEILKSQYKETPQNDVKEKSKNIFPNEKDKIFAYNPGKAIAPFPPKHPYYKVQNSLALTKYSENLYINNRAKQIHKSLVLNLVKKEITIKRNDLPSDIIFTSKGIKEALNQPHKNKLLKNELINTNIVETIKQGKSLKKTVEDSKGRFKQFRYIEIKINNELSWIVLREKNNGEIDFYSIVDFLKEK